MKSLYRHKTSGDLFAIETDNRGCIVSSSGPLLCDSLDPRALDYDDYWNDELAAKLVDFDRITKDDYRKMLIQNGFIIQSSQRHLF